MLSLYKNLLRIRPRLGGHFELARADDTWLAYRRGTHAVWLNFSDSAQRISDEGEVVVRTHPEAEAVVPPHGGVVIELPTSSKAPGSFPPP